MANHVKRNLLPTSESQEKEKQECIFYASIHKENEKHILQATITFTVLQTKRIRKLASS